MEGRISRKGLRGALGPIVTVIFFIALLSVLFFNYFYRSKQYAVSLIADDIALLQRVFKRIDDTCRIIDFDYQKNPINFLNVGSFEGSEVGPMNLTYPTQWKGPYVDDNPTMQSIEYQVVHTKDGYFIVPGQGVRLPSGKIVGTDIMFDKDADIPAMMRDENALKHNDRVLAAPLPLKTSSLQQTLLRTIVHNQGV